MIRAILITLICTGMLILIYVSVPDGVLQSVAREQTIMIAALAACLAGIDFRRRRRRFATKLEMNVVGLATGPLLLAEAAVFYVTADLWSGGHLRSLASLPFVTLPSGDNDWVDVTFVPTLLLMMIIGLTGAGFWIGQALGAAVFRAPKADL